MIYFIPAWYKVNSWDENEQCWYVRKNKSEFDDTVKQIQLFHRKGEWDYNVLLLNYAPNLRHFLHRQGMFRANYWSCFDAMCSINRRKASLFSYLDIKWPDGIEFEYSPFVIVANKDDKKYAQIEFGEDGNMIRIDMFENDKIIRSNIYDDRGFVSSSVIYEDGKEEYREYYSDKGVRKLRVFACDGHVEIGKEAPYFTIHYEGNEYQIDYKHSTYNRIDEVISEILSEYVALTEDKDIFCVAMHDRHTDVIMNSLLKNKLILSFFEGRLQQNNIHVVEILKRADYVITDSEHTIEKVKEFDDTITRISDISPYDSRTDFGISQQLSVQKILVPVDNLKYEVFRKTILELAKYMKTNDNAVVSLFTRNAYYDIKRELMEQVREALASEKMDVRIALYENDDKDNMLEEQEKVPIRFFVEQCVDELTVSKCVKEQRILVDMNDVPELYVQISAISSCIPQIVRKQTQYIEDGENGRIVSGPQEIRKWMHFYLDGLANWNDAKICSYEMGQRFSTEVLLDKWRKVIETVG